MFSFTFHPPSQIQQTVFSEVSDSTGILRSRFPAPPLSKECRACLPLLLLHYVMSSHISPHQTLPTAFPTPPHGQLHIGFRSLIFKNRQGHFSSPHKLRFRLSRSQAATHPDRLSRSAHCKAPEAHFCLPVSSFVVLTYVILPFCGRIQYAAMVCVRFFSCRFLLCLKEKIRQKLSRTCRTHTC